VKTLDRQTTGDLGVHDNSVAYDNAFIEGNKIYRKAQNIRKFFQKPFGLRW
jgi:hypothetical protein